MGIILVAEDSPTASLLICELVKNKGHTPVRARNGRVAWDFLQDNHNIVDLIVTDLMMPEMDGHELIAKIRECGEMSTIPILVQSAYVGVKETARLMENGADCIMPKPIDKEYLLEYIERYVADTVAA